MDRNSNVDCGYNLAAEMALLGAAIVDAVNIGGYVDDVSADYFVEPSHKRAWGEIARIYRERGAFEASDLPVDLQPLVLSLIEAFHADPDVRHNIRLLREALARRRLKDVCAEFQYKAAKGDAVAADLVADLGDRLTRIDAPFGEIASLDLDAWRAEMQVAPTGRKTGYDGLDAAFELAPGAVHYVVGYTGHGKTTFLVNVALNFLRDYHDPVLYFSLEETRLALITRFISTLCGPEGLSIKSVGNYFKGGPDTRAENAVIEGAYSGLAELGPRLYLEDKGDLTTADIARLTRGAAKAHGGVGLVLVDYVQLITPPATRNQYRYLELGDISQALLAIAKNNGVPVIAAAQARRPQGQRGDVAPPPKLHDLRESANLEQDAALVLSVYSPSGVVKTEGTVETENYDTTLRLEVLKSRYGPKGKIIYLDYYKAPGVMADRTGAGAF